MRHADDCDYHLDQYPHECTCGVSNPKEPDTMSNETPVGGFDNEPPKTILPVIGPITDDGVIVMSDAPYDANTTYVRAADDVPPIGPIPADDLLFSMNETQAVYLYIAHGLSGAQSHDEMIEMLRAKRDTAPAEPQTLLERAADVGASVAQVVEDFTVDVTEEAAAPIMEGSPGDGGTLVLKTIAPEPTPEREKVWNIHLQAWV